MRSKPFRKPRLPFISLVFVLAALPLAACGDDDNFGVGPFSPLVGGPCTDDLDCVSGAFCLRGGDFPQGTCTVACRSHADCPLGAACIDEEHGVCLPECIAELDCRGGYDCKERDDRNDPGKSRVCIR
jgi:hypothetical protein